MIKFGKNHKKKEKSAGRTVKNLDDSAEFAVLCKRVLMIKIL